ncbi:MAG: hypothetical protein L0211_06530 [Planctomycetaceae bacterium]|nr:hypothetical protein [Planctomycetaceae bacterium]
MLKSVGFLLAGVVIIGVGALVWFQFEYMFWTALDGPTDVSLAELAKIEDPKQLPSEWIRVKCDKVVETSVVVERSDGAIMAKYLLVPVGDRWMIAAVKDRSSVNVIEGQLYNSNCFANHDAIEAIVSEHQDLLRGRIYPFQFHGEVDYRDNGLYIPVVAGLTAVVGLVLGCMGIGGISLGLRDPAATQVAAMAAADRTIDRILHDKRPRG